MGADRSRHAARADRVAPLPSFARRESSPPVESVPPRVDAERPRRFHAESHGETYEVTRRIRQLVGASVCSTSRAIDREALQSVEPQRVPEPQSRSWLSRRMPLPWMRSRLLYSNRDPRLRASRSMESFSLAPRLCGSAAPRLSADRPRRFYAESRGHTCEVALPIRQPVWASVCSTSRALEREALQRVEPRWGPEPQGRSRLSRRMPLRWMRSRLRYSNRDPRLRASRSIESFSLAPRL
jgi:hypothetical protein